MYIFFPFSPSLSILLFSFHFLHGATFSAGACGFIAFCSTSRG